MKNLRVLTGLSTIVWLSFSSAVYGQQVHYVSASATGANNGSSWAEAFTNLQDALDAAQAGDEIWVAAGSYYPDLGSGITPGDTAATFQLKSDVAIYGGFNGTETERANRNPDPASNGTILDGDLDHDPGASGSVKSQHVVSGADLTSTTVLDGFEIREGNADSGGGQRGGGIYLQNSSVTLGNLLLADCTASLGGISIQGPGNVDLTSVEVTRNAGDAIQVTGATVAIEDGNFHHNNGRGVAVFNGGDVTINQSQLTHNVNTSDRGGGFYNDTGGTMAIRNTVVSLNSNENSSLSGIASLGAGGYNRGSLVMALCDVEGNLAYGSGFGIYNNSGASAIIIGCTIIGNHHLNSTSGRGGGIYNAGDLELYSSFFFSNEAEEGGGVYNSGTLETMNLVFSGNYALRTGGGLHNDATAEGATLRNVTMSGNNVSLSGGGVYNENVLTLYNSILWGNTSELQSPELRHNPGAITSIGHSIIQGGLPNGATDLGGNLDQDPLFMDADGADDTLGTRDDDFNLSESSPAIDAGNNDWVPQDSHDVDGDGDTEELWPVDIGSPVSLPAPVQAASASVHAASGGEHLRIGNFILDMGAYEYATQRGSSLTEVGTTTTLADNYPLAVANTENKSYVVVASHSQNQLQTWELNRTTGDLTPAMSSPIAVGDGPVAAVATPDGAWVVVAFEEDSTLQVYAVSSATGNLTAEGTPVSTVGTSPKAMAISPNGLMVAVANAGGDGFAVYELSSATGALTLCDSLVSPSAFAPEAVAISDGGLAVLGNADGSLGVFQVNLATGLLSLLENSTSTGGDFIGSLNLNAATDTLYAGVGESGVGFVLKYSINSGTGATTLTGSNTNLGFTVSSPKTALSSDEQHLMVVTADAGKEFRVLDANLNVVDSTTLSNSGVTDFIIKKGPPGFFVVNETDNGTTTVVKWNSGTGGTTAPLPPSGLSGTATGPNSVDLTWTDNADNEDSYAVDRRVAGSGQSFTEIASLPADSVSFSDTGLSPATSYEYQVRAVNTVGEGVSNIALVTTPDVPPAAPSALAGSASGPNSVDLTWTDNASNEDGFRVQRRLPGGSFSDVSTVGADVTAYTDGSVADDTTYEYQVIAFNTAGDSGPSNVVSVTPPPAPTPPAAPSNLVASAAGPNRVDLTWTDNADNEDSYAVDRRVGGTGAAFTQIASLPADSTSYSDTTVSPATQYDYRVRTINTGGESESNTASVTTPLPELRFTRIVDIAGTLQMEFEGPEGGTFVFFAPSVEAGFLSALPGAVSPLVLRGEDAVYDVLEQYSTGFFRLQSGPVPSGSIMGTVVDTNGMPVAGQQVCIGNSPGVVTDASGNFTFTNVPAGNVPVVFKQDMMVTNETTMETRLIPLRTTIFVELEEGKLVDMLVQAHHVREVIEPPCGCVPWCGIAAATIDGKTIVSAFGGKKGECEEPAEVTITDPGGVSIINPASRQVFKDAASGTWTVTATVCGETKTCKITVP